jgi:hypothetical protein
MADRGEPEPLLGDPLRRPESPDKEPGIGHLFVVLVDCSLTVDPIFGLDKVVTKRMKSPDDGYKTRYELIYNYFDY